MKDKRIGKFYIDVDVIERDPEKARAILKDVIVVRAEAMWHMNKIEYIGLHPRFKEISPLIIPPVYSFFFVSEDHEATWTEELPYGRIAA